MSAKLLASRPALSAAAMSFTWQREGWTPGLPPQVSESVFRIDREIYKHFSCPGCKKRKQDVRPFRKGDGYRVLLACETCDRGTEV